ncbi:MAG: transcription antitermination factor NusB [Myxococcota bacterium]
MSVISNMSVEAVSSREIAIHVLHRVFEEGAYAMPTLDAAIRRGTLQQRDAALATQIVYGTLRVVPSLDRALEPHSARPKRTDPWVRTALRAAAYQILYLTRVPPRAVVHETVSIVQRKRGKKVGGFVNAVLRKIQRVEGEAPPELLELPTWLSHQLLDRPCEYSLLRRVSPKSMPPPLGVRLCGIDRLEFIERLLEFQPHAEVALDEELPCAISVLGAADPRKWPGYATGQFVIQERGSQRVGGISALLAKGRVLDACAGHGSKTMQLLQSAASVVATDLHGGKLKSLRREYRRLGLQTPLDTRTVDFASGTLGLSEERFDHILVDAPCTGLGTVARRPELLLRLKPEDPSRMAVLQYSILEHVSALLKPGGVLCYSVCSPHPSEGAEVASRFLAERSGWSMPAPPVAHFSTLIGSDGGLRLGDSQSDLDNYQIYLFQRGDPSADLSG